MRTGDLMNQGSGVEVGALVGMRGTSTPSSKNTAGISPVVPNFDLNAYSRFVQQMTKMYVPFDQPVAALPLALTTPHPLTAAHILPTVSFASSDVTKTTPSSTEASATIAAIVSKKSLKTSNEDVHNLKHSKIPIKSEAEDDHALDLSTQGVRSLYSSYQRITLDQVKPKVVEDLWVENDATLSWKDSRVASYNPAQKLFMCVDCDSVGFLSRVAEHWLGAHANLRVFHCPRCPYTSAWSRCVKMHLTRQHEEQFADTTMWKGNSTLLEVTKLMQDLRTKVETRIDSNSTLADKRFYCPHCPYATDRRDLFTRHENIHKDNKPFHCYICFKQFNRADHVKKHFVRMHPDTQYDINKIRKQPGSTNSRTATTSTTTVKSSPISTTPILSTDTKGLVVSPVGTTSSSLLTSQMSKTTPILGPSPPTAMPALAVAALAPPPNIPPIPGEGSPASPGIALTGGTESPEPGAPRGRRRGGAERAYTCPYCHWSGTDNWCLKRHMNTHIKPFACIMCDYKAARAERLSTHVWKVHNKRICSKCSFLADTQEGLLEHTREEHHNNPYSRRFICNTCGLSFDTRPSLETHLHLAHTRVALPDPHATLFNVKTPLFDQIIPEQDSAQDLTIKRESEKCIKSLQQLVCPVKECHASFSEPGSLADHVRADHVGEGASKCPHCGYSLTNDELSKDHWLTHHKDVCPACVHVFTAVYGPQLWKKVHVKSNPSESHLDAIVSGLSRKRCAVSSGSPSPDVMNQTFESQSDLSICSEPQSPVSETQDIYDTERLSNKRSRKQLCPKKVILVDEPEDSSDDEKMPEVDLLHNLSKTDNLKLIHKKCVKKRMKSRVLSSLFTKHCCMKCSRRPIFSSKVRLQMHKKWRHRKSKLMLTKDKSPKIKI